MSRWSPDVMTLWVIRAPDEQAILKALKFGYDEDGEALASPFALAFNIGWYDEDFAELHFGEPALKLLTQTTETWRTIEEQAKPRFPAREWNGLYIIGAGAGEE